MLSKLERLTVLKLNNNHIKRIPYSIRRMKNLRFFHFANNELASVPSTMARMTFDTIDFSGLNMFSSTSQSLINFENNSNSLLYMTANVVINRQLKYNQLTLPNDVIDILETSPFCGGCGKLCALTLIEQSKTFIQIRVKELIRIIENIPMDVVYCSDRCRNQN